MNKAQVYFVSALIFALLVTVFALQNPESIGINFLVWRFQEISKVLVILASTAIGALVVIFLGIWWQFKKFMYVRQLEGEIRELKNRLDEVSIKEGKEKMEECGEEMSKK
ncbi:MAG TPA: DUF1049 domain-containing protein [Desulfotomaculum sp.]|jgi:uncharacterized integral membrane protein|nr:DUF1049 domain-containing protein [Desulfotomaculum sp.]